LTPYTLRSTNYLCQKSAELGESVGAFATRLLGGPTPWSKMRHAYKLLHLGERYTSLRLNLACEKALTVDLIDVRRLEKILKEALEQEAVPSIGIQLPLPGRFARPGRVFAIGSNNGNQVNEQITSYPGGQTNQGGIL